MSKNRPIVSERKHPANYLKSYRKKAGLSQRELGMLVNYLSEGSVSRHEQSKVGPPLCVAIGYEIIFKAPVSVIFHEMKNRMESAVNRQLLKFEKELQTKAKTGPPGNRAHRKILWLTERRNIDQE